MWLWLIVGLVLLTLVALAWRSGRRERRTFSQTSSAAEVDRARGHYYDPFPGGSGGAGGGGG